MIRGNDLKLEIIGCSCSPASSWFPRSFPAFMKSIHLFPLLAASLFALLTSCANTQNPTADADFGVGPFDAEGNYREDWADDPSKWRRPSKKSRDLADQAPVYAENDVPPAESTPFQATTPAYQPKPSSSASKSKASRPTSRSVAAKPKSRVTTHIVKKGDTLDSIAKRNGSSVAAIRKVNKISGSLIRPGQKLVVPKVSGS
jgi:LysM repeat protein